MDDPKLFTGLKPDQKFTYADLDTLLVEDAELGLCSVDLSKPPSGQIFVPVKP